MKRIDCGTSGGATPPCEPRWQELLIDQPWKEVLSILCPGGALRPVQIQALVQLHILESRRNLIVSAPTNAGKSLIGLLALLDATCRGRRAVLLEPLRAIAQEKVEE